jgi:hypothetical protein
MELMDSQKNTPTKVVTISPVTPVQKKLVAALSCLETYLVRSPYNANKIAEHNGKIAYILNTEYPGWRIIIIPKKPIRIAKDLRHPTLSPNIGPDNAAMING